jgi:hypothetical protein
MVVFGDFEQKRSCQVVEDSNDMLLSLLRCHGDMLDVVILKVLIDESEIFFDVESVR